MRRPSFNFLTALCWLVAAGFAAWAVARGFGLERGYPLVPLLAFTPYVALLGLLAAGLVLAVGRRAPATAIAAASLVLIALVLPRALPDGPPDPRPTGPSLRVMTANLLVGKAEIPPLADLVADGRVDLLSIAELTPEADADIRRSRIGELLPHRVVDPRAGSSGTGLYSRYPLERLSAPGTNGKDLPTVIGSLALPGGEAAEVYSIHPFPPNGPSAVAGLERYLEAIPSAEAGGPPRLLIGDFNATLDSAALRELLDRGYTDAAAATGDGLSWTWPQKLIPPPVTIDHSVVDQRVEVLDHEAMELPGSDHRATISGLRLPSTAVG